MSKFHHTVHFWLRDDLTDQQRADVLAGVRSLGQSENVESIRVAVPANTPREVVDNSYDIQLLAIFTDRAAHERYQSDDDAAHNRFKEEFKEFWTKVVIYDSVEAENT